MHHPTDRITHTTAFVTPVVEHWLEREIAQWVAPTDVYVATLGAANSFINTSLGHGMLTMLLLRHLLYYTMNHVIQTWEFYGPGATYGPLVDSDRPV